jgi:cytochrome c oxidase assembly factor CtaG
MTDLQHLLRSWDFHPSVVVGCLFLFGAYLFAVRGRMDKRTFLYGLGVLTIFLALVSPIDMLGDQYLFSAHMLQHMMLGLIAPALIILGLPSSLANRLLQIPLARKLESILGYPPLSLMLAVGTFWVWHLPVLYNATLENELVHIFEHLTFLVTGTILWWPVFKPIPTGKLSGLVSVVYLTIAALLNSILGIIFTVSDVPIYSSYAHLDDSLGLLKLIRNDWALSQLDDQKMGGAIMWAFGGLIFLCGMMIALVSWLYEPDPDEYQFDEWRAANVRRE